VHFKTLAIKDVVCSKTLALVAGICFTNVIIDEVNNIYQLALIIIKRMF
jgi:hypothetical protein